MDSSEETGPITVDSDKDWWVGDFGNLTINGAQGTTSSVTISPSWLTTSTIGTTADTITLTDFSNNWSTGRAEVSRAGELSLHGEHADIKINGESLMEMIRGIEERLNIMRPNPELEAEWDQLRELGEQYRAMEKKLQEQSKMWDTLKRMPPPDIK